MGKIPNKWNQVTLAQYIELELLPQPDNKSLEKIIQHRTVQAHILTGLSVEEIDRLKFEELTAMKEFLESKMPERIVKRFKLNGVKYEVELDPCKLDANRLVSVLNLIRKGAVKNMPQILFNICRPFEYTLFGRKYYDIEPYDVQSRINDFKTLTMDIVNPLTVFFFNLSQNLLDGTLSYLDQKMIETNREVMEALEEIKQEAGLNVCTDG